MRGTLEKHCSANAMNYRDMENDQECVIGGIISDVRYRITRRNDKMAFVRLEDLYGTIPVTFFPNALKTCEQQLVKDRIVLIKGKASHRERIAATDEGDSSVEVEIRGESVSPLRNGNGNGNGKVANGNGSRPVHIKINGSPNVNLDLLKSLIEAYPGESPVYFWMCHCGTRQKIATHFRVEANTKFVTEVERVLGRDVIRVG
jgi:DNA polymerase-3 subunit alpha